MKNDPIGIFDSGIGGLTVAKAISELLPSEDLLYFGDTLHLPYGEKSLESIKRYSLEITHFLLQQNVKSIVIACNSASAAAYENVVEAAGEIPVINVIDPMADYINQNFLDKKVGVVGTKATIGSGIYPSKINSNIEVVSKATPLLAYMIEEGFLHDEVSKLVISSYLSAGDMDKLDALILGCTHYPLIHSDFEAVLGEQTKVIDSSTIVAQELRAILQTKRLLNDTKATGEKTYFVSDLTSSFQEMANTFMGQHLELIETEV